MRCKTMYAHIEQVVAFLVVNFFDFWIITRHHAMRSWQKLTSKSYQPPGPVEDKFGKKKHWENLNLETTISNQKKRKKTRLLNVYRIWIRIWDSRHSQVAVFDEESEFQVENKQILDPGGKI